MKRSGRHIDFAIAAGLLAAVALAWWPALGAALVYDDVGAIVESPHVRSLWPVWHAASGQPGAPTAGRPVVALSFAANYAVHGLSPAGYHLVNVVIHALNALLVFALVRAALMLVRAREERDSWQPMLSAYAAAVAAIWAVHPLQSDAVIYVSQRTELLLAFFILMTLWAHLHARLSQQGSRAATAWIALAVASCALGMACKEVMVVAPVLVWLFDYAFLRDTPPDTPPDVTSPDAATPDATSPQRLGRKYWAALFATWLVLIAINVSNPRGGSAGFATEITPWQYLLTQASVIPHYISLVFAPIGLTMAYDWPLAHSLRDALPDGLIVLALLVAGALLLWRRPTIGFLFAWFFLILAPSSSFVPIATEYVAERRMYLPLLAFVAGSAALLLWLSRTLARGDTQRGRALAGGCVLLMAGWLVTYAFNTPHARARAFATHEGAWLAVLQTPPGYHPGYCTAWNNLGSMYLDEGRRDEARQMFESLMHSCADDPRGPHYLGLMAAQEGDHERAIAFYRKGLQRAPESPPILSDMGAALARLARMDEAVDAWQRAVAANPRDAKALSNLGLAQMQRGRSQEGLALLERAVAVEPGDAGARIALAQGYFIMRRPFEGDQQLDAAIGLSGGSAGVLIQTAQVRLQFGDVEGAAADLTAAAQQGSSEAAEALRELNAKQPTR